MCRFLAPGALSGLTAKGNAAKVGQAEDILHEARETIRKCTMDQKDATKVVGRLDCRIVAFLLNKQKDMTDGMQFTSLEEICEARCACNNCMS